MRRLFFFLTFLLSHTITSFACECPPVKPLDKTYTDQFDLVFLGTVDSVSACNDHATSFFRIDTLYKGRSFETTEVNFDCSTSCQMSFSKAERWIIYAKYVKYGVSEVAFCSRSRKDFVNDSLDYFVATYGLTFKEEAEKLKTMLGNISFLKDDGAIEMQHELIKPKGYTLLWLIVISTLVLGALLYFSKGLKK